MPTVTRRPPYQAQLRVYEPLAHLAPRERARWTAYASVAPSRAEVEAELYVDTIRRLAGHPPVPVPAMESRHAWLLEEDSEIFICPVQPRLQVWQRLDDGRLDRAQGQVRVETVPPALREQAVADYAAHRGSGADVRLYSRSTAWQVPVSWFVPFAAVERRLVIEPERSLTYRTAMSAARRRAAIALRTAKQTLGDLDLATEIEVVARWLEEFDPRSRVELDYGGLADLLGGDQLSSDDSASDVAEGLAALGEGDATSAAAAYRRWTTRWQRVGLLSRAS